MRPRSVALAALVTLVTALTACGAAPVASPEGGRSAVAISPSASASAEGSAPAGGGIEPAPGSSSRVYEPNPGAIVVAIDAGHGGCLDWGVPDPSERGVELAEKTLTLAIATRLSEKLQGEGVGVVMLRAGDEALAGDDYPPLGCSGEPWRDVNGDGISGFGPDVPEATRTRDELQARLDLANLAGADALLSIHINSPSEGGQRIEIAFSETYYTDETTWGPSATAELAQQLQRGVVDRLAPLATYERGDRGITAHNLYIVAPPLYEPTADRPDPVKQPTRGGLMPVVLAEVGSITLRDEHDLLASDAGQDAVADGLLDGLAGYIGGRQLAARIGLAGDAVPTVPPPLPGDGPMFWAPAAPEGPVALRLTNTGTMPWPSDAELVAGWEATEQPYLRRAPEGLRPIPADVPALEPGESVVVEVDLGSPAGSGRAVAWISLDTGDTTTADLGSPALQLGSTAP